MKQKRRKRKPTKQTTKNTLYYEMGGLILFALSVIAILRFGVVGNVIVSFLRFFFGEWYILSLFFFIKLAIIFMIKRKIPDLLQKRYIGLYLIYFTVLMFSHIRLFALLTENGATSDPSILRETWNLFWLEISSNTALDLGGGIIGALMLAACYFLFSARGAVLIGIIFILLGLLLLTGKPLTEIFGKIFKPILTFIRKQFNGFLADMKDWKGKQRLKKVTKEKDKEEDLPQKEPIIANFAEDIIINMPEKHEQLEMKVEEVVPPVPMKITNEADEDYQLPPVNLLNLPKNKKANSEQDYIYENARKLEKTFQSFNVKAKVTQVHMGPAVTKYEVYPDAGVKVSKIVSLTDDLALALAAKDIRMEAPIPGKSAIGIEVPNQNISMVTLREVLEAKENNRTDDKLMVVLGRDVTGKAAFAHLNKMPHLLIAGSTGSGKSVCINGIITSILMRAKPHEVRLLMIDPKMVELKVYDHIPHLIAPVVINPKQAAQALRNIVKEMEKRYQSFSETGTRNIEGYNEFATHFNGANEVKMELFPYIVVIVDELADLMMVAAADVEDSIIRLAQMARAAGIHMIIATQRPSVDVITGIIKANIPSRLSFALTSQVDSRTILDMSGAEKLLGSGDMLFMPIGAPKPIRVQGAYVSDEEVEKVVNFIKGQKEAQYQEEMIITETKEVEEEVDDVLFQEAVDFVVDMQKASVSMLQRRFRIGYARAARLVDAMEERGVVGPYEGSKPREVLLTKQEEQAN